MPKVTKFTTLAGQKANDNGRFAEDTIACILERQRACIFSRQVFAGIGVDERRIVADMQLTSPQFPRGLYIESRWQETSGTADQKIGLVLWNITRGCYNAPVVIVAAGGGATPAILRFARTFVDGRLLFGLFSLEEFITWTRKSL